MTDVVDVSAVAEAGDVSDVALDQPSLDASLDTPADTAPEASLDVERDATPGVRSPRDARPRSARAEVAAST